MVKVQDIQISKIKLDSYPVSASTLDLAMKIKLGTLNIEDLPPIKLRIDENGTYKIKNGRHRVLAFRMNEIETIKAKVSKPKVKVKQIPRKKHSRNKISNAVSLFEKTMMLETIELKKLTKKYFHITASNGQIYSVDLSTNKVDKIYPDL